VSSECLLCRNLSVLVMDDWKLKTAPVVRLVQTVVPLNDAANCSGTPDVKFSLSAVQEVKVIFCSHSSFVYLFIYLFIFYLLCKSDQKGP